MGYGGAGDWVNWSDEKYHDSARGHAERISKSEQSSVSTAGDNANNKDTNMAYQNNGGYNKQQQAAAPRAPMARPAQTQTGATKTKRDVIFATGLFSPNKEGVKSVGSVQVKEDVLIPAGTYINLYANDKVDGKGPAFKLQFTPGQVKAKA